MIVVTFKCAVCEKPYEVPYRADLDLSFECSQCKTPLCVKVCPTENRDEPELIVP